VSRDTVGNQAHINRLKVRLSELGNSSPPAVLAPVLEGVQGHVRARFATLQQAVISHRWSYVFGNRVVPSPWHARALTQGLLNRVGNLYAG
jgi:hypothetical protein